MVCVFALVGVARDRSFASLQDDKGERSPLYALDNLSSDVRTCSQADRNIIRSRIG